MSVGLFFSSLSRNSSVCRPFHLLWFLFPSSSSFHLYLVLYLSFHPSNLCPKLSLLLLSNQVAMFVFIYLWFLHYISSVSRSLSNPLFNSHYFPTLLVCSSLLVSQSFVFLLLLPFFFPFPLRFLLMHFSSVFAKPFATLDKLGRSCFCSVYSSWKDGVLQKRKLNSFLCLLAS